MRAQGYKPAYIRKKLNKYLAVNEPDCSQLSRMYLSQILNFRKYKSLPAYEAITNEVHTFIQIKLEQPKSYILPKNINDWFNQGPQSFYLSDKPGNLHRTMKRRDRRVKFAQIGWTARVEQRRLKQLLRLAQYRQAWLLETKRPKKRREREQVKWYIKKIEAFIMQLQKYISMMDKE